MISCLGILAMNFMTINHQNKVIAENISDQNETEFRAAWISYYTGDINYQGQQNYMDKIDNILDTLEYYNMNAMIFIFVLIMMLGITQKLIRLILS